MSNFGAIFRQNWIKLVFLLFVYLTFSIVFVCFLTPVFSVDGYKFGDDLIFEIIGKAWSDGTPAYTYYLDHKGPFVYLFFCVGYLINGTRSGLIMFCVLWTVLSMILAHLLLYGRDFRHISFKKLFVNSFLIICGFIYIWVMYDLVHGVTVGRIILPVLLLCAIIFKYWLCDDNYVNTTFMHVIYGILCAFVVLSRASDAIGIILFYMFYWVYGVVTTRQIWKYMQKAVLTIFGGLLPFVICLVYFGWYDVASAFMDCTFWANFRYEVPYKDCTGISIIAILFGILTIFMIVDKVCLKHKNIVGFICWVVCLLQSAFVVLCTASFVHYAISLSVFIVFDLVLYKQAVQFIMSRFRVCIIGILSIFVVIGISAGVFMNVMLAEHCSADAYSDVCNMIMNSDKSIVVLDSDAIIGALFDKGYMPKSRHCANQSWYIECNVVSENDMLQSFDTDKIDEIWYFVDAGASLPDWLNKDNVSVYKKTRSFEINNDYVEATCYVFEK